MRNTGLSLDCSMFAKQLSRNLLLGIRSSNLLANDLCQTCHAYRQKQYRDCDPGLAPEAWRVSCVANVPENGMAHVRCSGRIRSLRPISWHEFLSLAKFCRSLRRYRYAFGKMGGNSGEIV